MFFLFPLSFASFLSLIAFLIYTRRIPLGINLSGQWSWFAHPWSGFGVPLELAVLAILILAFSFNYLIKKRTPAWLVLVLVSLLMIVLPFFLFDINIWLYSIVRHGDMAYYVLARSQIYDGNIFRLIAHYLDGLIADRFPGYGFNTLIANTGTHPPGPVVFYQLLENLMLFIKSTFNQNLQLSNEPVMVTVIKAIFNSFSLIPLYFLGRSVASRRVALGACLFLAVSPAFSFFMLYPDVSNMIFLILIFLFLIKAEKSFWFFLPSAATAALSTFMSFGYFIFYPLIAFWLLIRYWQKAISSRQIVIAATIYSSVLLAWLILAKYLLNYDYSLGWLLAAEAHQAMTGQRQIGDWYWLNYLDLIQFAGYPAFLLSLIGLWLARYQNKKSAQTALVYFGLLVFFIINSISITRGEVGRIWAVFYLLIYLSAAISLSWLKKYSEVIFILAIFFSIFLTLVMRGTFTTFSFPNGYL